jgi:hypothetical protein
MGDGIAGYTSINVWRRRRIGLMMKPNRKSWPLYNRRRIAPFGKGQTTHWENTFKGKASVRFRLRMGMVASWSLTHKKEYRM